MKRTRNILILAGVLVVLCGIIAVENLVSRHVDSINTTDEVILTVDQSALTEVTWSYEDVTLTFTNADGAWSDADDAAFPVSQNALEEFLAHFEEVHACFIIDDVSDYDQYGLSDPQCTITLTTEDGETVVSLGDYSTMDAQRYVSVGDGKVYLIEDDLLEYVSTERDDFMQHDSLADFDTLASLTIEGETEIEVVYDPDGVYSYTDTYNYYALSDGDYLTLDDSQVESYLSALTSLSLTDYVTYTASDEDLSVYGLDSPAFTITVCGVVEADEDEGTEEETVEYTVYIGAVTEEDEETGETTVTAYLRVGDSEIVYNLSSDTFATLSSGSYNDLRPTAVYTLDWTAVTGVTVTLDGTDYAVTVTDKAPTESDEDDATDTTDTEEETLYYLLDGQEIDFDAVMDAVDALTINSFTDEAADGTQELALTVYLDNEDYPSVSVTIYQYDGEDCLVVLEGETLGLMSRDLMVDLREAMTSIVLGLA